jgi:hypothetical protein
MAVGDYVQRHDHIQARAGKPIRPRSKAHILGATRAFFRDCQEWEWIPRRFDPGWALAVPRSVAALIGADPRVIADEVWAKLLWSGLNLQVADLPGCADSYYPIELIRAVTLTWLFCGLRSDEIRRLPVGCIRWSGLAAGTWFRCPGVAGPGCSAVMRARVVSITPRGRRAATGTRCRRGRPLTRSARWSR